MVEKNEARLAVVHCYKIELLRIFEKLEEENEQRQQLFKSLHLAYSKHRSKQKFNKINYHLYFVLNLFHFIIIYLLIGQIISLSSSPFSNLSNLSIYFYFQPYPIFFVFLFLFSYYALYKILLYNKDHGQNKL